MKKRIVLCADDYGQASPISAGIIELVKQGRLSAVSCMVNAPGWAHDATLLQPHQRRIQAGLHFNLTEGQPLSDAFRERYGQDFPSLKTLLLKSLLRRLDQKVIEAELHAQLNSFEQALGCRPDFIDGHQHVHQFPQVRDALLTVYDQRFQIHRPAVRLVKLSPIVQLSRPRESLKKLILHYTGSQTLERRLIEHKIPYNQSFSGVYRFADHSRYAARFPDFLSEIGEGGLIMCHPGLPSSDDDAIADARYAEYLYFMSAQFQEHCQQANVVLHSSE